MKGKKLLALLMTLSMGASLCPMTAFAAETSDETAGTEENAASDEAGGAEAATNEAGDVEAASDEAGDAEAATDEAGGAEVETEEAGDADAALDAVGDVEAAQEEENDGADYQYVQMNVPYNDFYAAYNLTDTAVWEVEEGIDAVSTATTSKFLMDALSNGTYKDDKYILGVYIPVAMSKEDYQTFCAAVTGKTESDAYYYTDLDTEPTAYTTMEIGEDGTYQFGKMTKSDIETKYLSVGELDITAGYGDYQISLDGVTTKNGIKVGETEAEDGTVEDQYLSYTIYGAILNINDTTVDVETSDSADDMGSGGSTETENVAYGMTCLENLWFGGKVTNVEIAWSIKHGKQLQRGHGNGGKFYQFNMNGGTLVSVTLITDLGLIEVPAETNQTTGKAELTLDAYYTGDLSGLDYSIQNGSAELAISGIPNDLEDVTISVSGNLATNAEISNGKVALGDAPEAGTSYTLTISSSNYPDITRTMSTPITEEQTTLLTKWKDKAQALINGEAGADSDLIQHEQEAEDLLTNPDATSVDAAELIEELKEKVKKYYPEASAAAVLSADGKELEITLSDVALDKLTNPEYSLTYQKGHGSATAAGGSLTTLSIAFDSAVDTGQTYTLTVTSDNYQDITSEVTVKEYKFVQMNVPYDEFYDAYDLTDTAVWEVEEGIDAVSTATTSKFLGTTGLAKGTYNDGINILGVTIPVAMTDEVYATFSEANAEKTETQNYYFTDLEAAPAAYTTMTIEEDGTYQFGQMTESDIETKYLSVGELDITAGYGDYQITLDGVSTTEGIKVGETTAEDGTAEAQYQSYTIYGAILNISGTTVDVKASDSADGTTTTEKTDVTYGMTCLENLWFGGRVTNVEIAWSIEHGKQLQRAHGNGGEFYQFNMNGGTLTSVTLITDLGLIEVPAEKDSDEAAGLELTTYYAGDLTDLTYAIDNDSTELTISGIPEDLEDVRISVSGNLAANAEISDGKVTLGGVPEAGTSYTLTISSSNYPDITRTMSTPVTEEQKELLQAWMEKANTEIAGDASGDSDLQQHAAEAEELLADESATSADVAELIEELKEKVKKYYPKASAAAVLSADGKELEITLSDVELNELTNPEYSLTYKKGHSSVTVAGGSLTSLSVAFDSAVDVDTETTYTLTVTSDNYQDITSEVTVKQAEEEQQLTDLASAAVKLAYASVVYDGKAKEPAVTVTYNGAALAKDTDYTVAYANNTNAGTATVTVTGKGNYTGTAKAAFTITAKALTASNVTLAQTSVPYNGKNQEPAVTVKDGSTTLKAGTDYTVAYANNKNKGTATVTVTGKGNYTGSVSKTFKITAAKQTITCKKLKATYKKSALKSKAKTFKIGASASGKGKITYSKKSNKGLSVTKAGKVTVKKGLKKGTYKIKVKITAAAKGGYKKTAVTKTITVKVK